MVFHLSLSDSKSPQVSRTHLSILADLKSAVVWMVSILPLIFSISSLFSRPCGCVPSAPIIIGIIVTFMFYSFPVICLSFPFLLFSFYGQLERKNLLDKKYFFLLNNKLSFGGPGLGDPFVCQISLSYYSLWVFNISVSWWSFTASHSIGWILVW